MTSPFNLNVRDLIGKPGSMREVDLQAPVEEHYGESLVAVPAGEQLSIEVRIESVHEGILVTVEGETTAHGECGRCLDPVTVPIEVEFSELFAYYHDEAFEYEVQDDHVNLEPLIRDAVVLALPFQPVCRPDCPGLDPQTGLKRTESGSAQDSEVLDPRWSALQGFEVSGDGTTDT